MPRDVPEAVQGPAGGARFMALVRPRLDHAYGLAWHLLGNPTDAEDACQEALAAAWSAWPRLRDADRFDAWFERILVNTCMESLRRRHRRPQSVLTDEPGIADRDALGQSDDRDETARALAALSPEQRVVVVLRFWADLPTDAIAERLGVPQGTVRSRLHYAMDAMRSSLGREAADG